MSMSARLQNYLDHRNVFYELVEHERTRTSREAAHKAHVPESNLAKAVILEDHRGYMMAVLPASKRLSMGSVRANCGEQLSLCDEDSLSRLFDDCETGAIPPLGGAYGLEVVWDDSLSDCDDVYFEAGDHTDLVHISGEDFRHLMGEAEHGQICH